MNIENIKNEIIKNNGLTIDKDFKKLDKKSGFMVSILGLEKTIQKKDINTLDNIIMEYKKIIENKKNMYIGFWIDNDLIYIDISKHVEKKQNAVNFGIKNKQLAIYDIKNNTCIDLLKNVYIVYQYNKVNNDIIYYKEFNSLKDIEKTFSIKNACQYICKNIDNITTLLKDRYIIVNDKISYNYIILACHQILLLIKY